MIILWITAESLKHYVILFYGNALQIKLKSTCCSPLNSKLEIQRNHFITLCCCIPCKQLCFHSHLEFYLSARLFAAIFGFVAVLQQNETLVPFEWLFQSIFRRFINSRFSSNAFQNFWITIYLRSTTREWKIFEHKTQKLYPLLFVIRTNHVNSRKPCFTAIRKK